MGLFGGQASNVIEWLEYDDETIFWKWPNIEIKKGSRLVIRAGQDAIFMVNGKLEGIFKEEGAYDIETDIIPFLSSLRGFRFGAKTVLRSEILFVNVREFTVKWGTRGAVTILSEGLPGGLPIRAFGTFQCKVDEYTTLIDQIAGVRQVYKVGDVKERVISALDPLVMKWISKEGKDIFNLQANSAEIAKGICEDLDMQMRKIGIAISGFQIQNVSYPEDVQAIARTAISHKFTAGSQPAVKAGSTAAATEPKFCPNCGTPAGGGNFCSNCGHKLK